MKKLMILVLILVICITSMVSCLATKASAEAKLGDVNGDGLVNSLDACIIIKFDAGLINDLDEVGDVNGDGRIDVLDGAMVLKYDVGYIDSF